MGEQLRLKHMVNKYNKKRHYELLKKKSMGINLQEYSSELRKYLILKNSKTGDFRMKASLAVEFYCTSVNFTTPLVHD